MLLTSKELGKSYSLVLLIPFTIINVSRRNKNVGIFTVTKVMKLKVLGIELYVLSDR